MNQICLEANQTDYPFILPALPFSSDALEPHMSAKTFSFHHQQHHNTYVNNLNKLLENSDLKGKSLEEIILVSHNSDQQIFNNAAQVWNHSFFWHCIKPNGGGEATGKIAKKLQQQFGSFENFVQEFKKAALGQFGSGWAWLVLNPDQTLSIVKTANANVPFVENRLPLLTLDVWEHAYYLDYQNLRAKFIDSFFQNLVNWDFVNKMLG